MGPPLLNTSDSLHFGGVIKYANCMPKTWNLEDFMKKCYNSNSTPKALIYKGLIIFDRREILLIK